FYIFILMTENEYGKEVSVILFPFTSTEDSLGATFCGSLNELTLLRSLPCNVVSKAGDENFFAPSKTILVACCMPDAFTTFIITSFVFLSITAEAYRLSWPVTALPFIRAGTVLVPLLREYN